MIPATYRDLIEVLSQKSREGAVAWRGTLTAGRFIIGISDRSYEVEEIYDDNEGEALLLRVRSDQGRTLDSFRVYPSEKADWVITSQLYAAARRTVARVDSAIDALAKATREQPFGSPKNDEPTDDLGEEIPF